MKPTSIKLLIALAVVGAATGWGLALVLDGVAGSLMPVPWTAPIALVLLVVGLLFWTVGTRRRLARRPGTKPLPPLLAARSAALAMAASRTGAVVAGFYAGAALQLLSLTENPLARQRGFVSIACAVLGTAMAAVALWLERSCRIPGHGDDDSHDGDSDA